MLEEQRQMIRGLVAGEPYATRQFISLWHPRIYRWLERHSWLRPVEDSAQQVWYHLLDGGWDRLLQWDGLYDDNAWLRFSKVVFVSFKKLTKLG